MKLLLLLAAIAPYQMPPAPPAPPAGGAALESELSRMTERYRTQCYSEKAIKLLVDHIRRARTTVRPDVAAIRAANKELADAAYAEPFDKNRMVLAMQASAQAQADQVIFARSNSGVTPTFPPKPCS
jgi:hypothetical protein